MKSAQPLHLPPPAKVVGGLGKLEITMIASMLNVFIKRVDFHNKTHNQTSQSPQDVSDPQDLRGGTCMVTAKMLHSAPTKSSR